MEDIVIRMRKLFCLKGAEFSRPELQEGWEEIERLRMANDSLADQTCKALREAERMSNYTIGIMNGCEIMQNACALELEKLMFINKQQSAALEKAREALETTTVENLEKFTYIVVSEEYKSLRKEVLAAIEELKK